MAGAASVLRGRRVEEKLAQPSGFFCLLPSDSCLLGHALWEQS